MTQVVVKTDLEQLSLQSCHFFLEQDRKIGVLPAASKFKVDVFPLKIEQNRASGTRDICYSMET